MKWENIWYKCRHILRKIGFRQKHLKILKMSVYLLTSFHRVPQATVWISLKTERGMPLQQGTELLSSVQSLSRVRLCNPMDCSTPGFPVLHQLLELAQTHVHWVGDAIQPSYPLSSPSPPVFSLSQHQGLFQWVSSLHQVAKVSEFQFQHQSF